MGIGPAEKRISEVRGEIDMLFKSAEEMGQAVKKLQERMHTITRIEPPEAGDEQLKEAEIVPLAAEIRTVRKKMFTYIRDIQRIIELCEL